MTSHSSNLSSKPLRIGIDCRLWNQTGVGRYIQNLVKNLIEIDRENEYVLFVSPQDFDYVKRELQNSKFEIIVTDIHWHSIKEQIEFPKILDSYNFDLVHFPYFSLPIFYKKPFVVTIHDLIINHFPTGKASTLPLPLYYAKRFGYDRVVSHAVKNSRRIIVPLNAVKNDLIKTLRVPENKISVTREGYDKEMSGSAGGGQISNEVKKMKNYFLYVGNAYPHKNLENLIKGFRLFRENSNSDVKLLLVGKDDYFYRKLKKSFLLKKNNSIIILNSINDDELSHLYKNATAVISASLMEGFGLVPLEAMAHGCLTIVSDIPSFREVCEKNVLYFNPNSIEDIEKKLNYAMKISYKEKNTLVQGGLKRVKEFSWKLMAEKTLEVYSQILSN